MESKFGEKAGWLKKKEPSKKWKTLFCIVRGTSFEVHKDDKVQDPPRPQETFELAGAKLQKVPSILLEGSQDAHHGTDHFSFMVVPRATVTGKPPQRHVFKPMHDEEKREWLQFLAGKSDARLLARQRGPRRSAGAEGAHEDEFDVDVVLSRLETYASLVSFRVQRRFIHLLSMPHEDFANLKTVVRGMMGMSAALRPRAQVQRSKSEQVLTRALFRLREAGDDDMEEEDGEEDEDEYDSPRSDSLQPEPEPEPEPSAPPPSSDESSDDGTCRCLRNPPHVVG